MGVTLTRRRLLQHCAVLPLAAVPLLHGCDKADTASCVDPALLSRGEEEMRKSLAYVEVSDLADKQCAGCQFFKAADSPGCGLCEILDGPVNHKAYCMSWARRS